MRHGLLATRSCHDGPLATILAALSGHTGDPIGDGRHGPGPLFITDAQGRGVRLRGTGAGSPSAAAMSDDHGGVCVSRAAADVVEDAALLLTSDGHGRSDICAVDVAAHERRAGLHCTGFEQACTASQRCVSRRDAG